MNKNFDQKIIKEINNEINRQNICIDLIASENYVSNAILKIQGSILTNKYAEGYCNKRYYGGCKYIDNIEALCIKRACKLFNVKYANVQPYSGSIANLAIYEALLKHGDTILSMRFDAGGHLTHGYKSSISGKNYRAIFYGLDKNGFINYDEIEKIAIKEKPKLIITGASSYSRIIDFKKFKLIANKINAYLLIDMAHIAGLVAADLYPNPCDYADVVSSTTHKTLRGPRGGIILSNNKEIMDKINYSIFPGIQGGPLEHVIAAKAVAFHEAMNKKFKTYQKQVIKNAYVMCEEFKKLGYKIESNGTDTHLFVVHTINFGLTGKEAENILSQNNIIVNRNVIFNDQLSTFETSGIRIGSPAITTRGFKENEVRLIVNLIDQIFKNKNNILKLKKIKKKIKSLLLKFPLPYKKLHYA